MTKRERAQVVELLRCAADQNLNRNRFRLIWNDLDCSGASIAWAQLACEAVDIAATHGAVAECLEAAARVEEGSWP